MRKYVGNCLLWGDSAGEVLSRLTSVLDDPNNRVELKMKYLIFMSSFVFLYLIFLVNCIIIIIIIIISTAAHFEPRSSSEASVSCPYSLQQPSKNCVCMYVYICPFFWWKYSFWCHRPHCADGNISRITSSRLRSPIPCTVTTLLWGITMFVINHIIEWNWTAVLLFCWYYCNIPAMDFDMFNMAGHSLFV